MTRFERLVNAYDYLEKRIVPEDNIVDIYEIDRNLFNAIVISKRHTVLKYMFDKSDYFKVEVLD